MADGTSRTEVLRSSHAVSDNNTADYSSRNPDPKSDKEVNSEEAFEDRIFLTERARGLPENITDKQLSDVVIKDTMKQIEKEGRVITWGLKKVGKRLEVVDGILLSKETLEVPKVIREEVMEKVHSQHHFWTAGTIQSLRRFFLD